MCDQENCHVTTTLSTLVTRCGFTSNHIDNTLSSDDHPSNLIHVTCTLTDCSSYRHGGQQTLLAPPSCIYPIFYIFLLHPFKGNPPLNSFIPISGNPQVPLNPLFTKNTQPLNTLTPPPLPTNNQTRHISPKVVTHVPQSSSPIAPTISPIHPLPTMEDNPNSKPLYPPPTSPLQKHTLLTLRTK